jgi:hypothetical protein
MQTKEELIQHIRQHLTLSTLWKLLKLPGGAWTNHPLCSPFRPADPARTFVIKGPSIWIDHRDNSSGDALVFLCKLRGCDLGRPTETVVDEFLALGVEAGLIRADELHDQAATVAAEMSSSQEWPGTTEGQAETEFRNVGMSEASPPPPDVTHIDTFRVHARERGRLIGIDGFMREATATRKAGKTAEDLLVLVPADGHILQADLATSAQRAGINEKLYRNLVTELLAQKRIFIHKIPREKAKSAIGYSRLPAER